MEVCTQNTITQKFSQKTICRNKVTENIERFSLLETISNIFIFIKQHYINVSDLIELSAILPAVIFMLGPLFSAGQWPGSDGGETDDAATTDGG